MFKLVGDTYGGKMLDLDLVPEGSTVISAGIGEEISFDLELIEKRNCHVVGVDPTEKASKFIERTVPKNFTFIKKALHNSQCIVRMHKNPNPNYVSESILASHNMVSKETYEIQSVTIPQLLEKYPNTSVIKMDIEGSEYDVMNDDTIKSMANNRVFQVCCEFHHFCTNYNIENTKEIIRKMKVYGFKFYVEKKSDQRLAELTFVHENVLE